LVFGVAVTWIAVYEGYDAPPTAEGVSGATTRTVVTSWLAILALDFVLTALMFRGTYVMMTRKELDVWVGIVAVIGIGALLFLSLKVAYFASVSVGGPYQAH